MACRPRALKAVVASQSGKASAGNRRGTARRDARRENLMTAAHRQAIATRVERICARLGDGPGRPLPGWEGSRQDAIYGRDERGSGCTYLVLDCLTNLDALLLCA